jgi:hypothetical protein
MVSARPMGAARIAINADSDTKPSKRRARKRAFGINECLDRLVVIQASEFDPGGISVATLSHRFEIIERLLIKITVH